MQFALLCTVTAHATHPPTYHHEAVDVARACVGHCNQWRAMHAHHVLVVCVYVQADFLPQSSVCARVYVYTCACVAVVCRIRHRWMATRARHSSAPSNTVPNEPRSEAQYEHPPGCDGTQHPCNHDLKRAHGGVLTGVDGSVGFHNRQPPHRSHSRRHRRFKHVNKGRAPPPVRIKQLPAVWPVPA